MDNREGAASYLHIWEKQSVIEPAEKIYCVEQGKFFFLMYKILFLNHQ